MLNNIRKILEVSKRGIVIVENGKPSYVIIPFDEYERNEFSDLRDSKERRDAVLEDVPYEINSEVQNILNKELEFNRKENSIFNDLNLSDDIDDIKKDLREIKLEDLPF